MTVFRYEMKAGLNAYLARLGAKFPMKTVTDVVAFNDQNSDKELPYFARTRFRRWRRAAP